jgi:hypothetical protein
MWSGQAIHIASAMTESGTVRSMLGRRRKLKLTIGIQQLIRLALVMSNQ